jgi:hypothetical protein
MLERLRRTYEELLTQSLAGVTQIELGLAGRPDAVQNAVTLLFQTSTRPQRPLPPGTSILHVYDEAAHELLILGQPGAGKSTLLVELAQQLVGRAETDETHPLPIILPLSSWADRHPVLQVWLVEQVAKIYDVPKKVARLWVDEGRILPLLDGLDEVEETARPACIVAINAYHRAHLRLPLVVCSRQVEYEEASKSQRLVLQNAVMVQPLTHEQVQAYLKQAGKTLAALRRALATHPTLASVATTPLMVHVLILTYQGTTVRRLSAQSAQLQQQVWTDYVQRMIERKRDTQHYTSHQIMTWLSFLARQMRDHNQTIFHLEQLQPDWLTKRQKRFYRMSIGPIYGLVAASVTALNFGLIFGLIGGFIDGLVTGLFFGLIIGPITVLVSGLFFGLKARIEPVEVLTWSWEKLKSRLAVELAIGLFFGLLSGLLFGLALGLLSGLLFGLLFGLVAALSIGFSGKPLIERLMLSPNEGMRRSLKNGLVGGLVSGLLIGLIIGLANALINELFEGLFLGLFLELIVALIVAPVSGLFTGLGAVTQHYTLRFLLRLTHTFPWKVQQLLDDAVICILLRRVGGGYSFVHRLLLDHLAGTEMTP